jgi:hypothetical protein
MSNEASMETVIQQYLDVVEKSLTHTPPGQRDTLLRELREHIQEAVHTRAAGKPPTLQEVYATLAEMDSPEAYADTLMPAREERKTNAKLIVLYLLCCGVQIGGLGAMVAGVPVIGAIGGFAAIVMFFILWSDRRSPKWLIRLTGVAALCGLVTILIEIAKAA